jgi:hypothetical protein
MSIEREIACKLKLAYWLTHACSYQIDKRAELQAQKI